MTGKEKSANIVKKVLKNPNQKSTHTGPTNSAGKSFSNRSEFFLVVVGQGSNQQQNLLSPNILEPNEHGGQNNIIGLEAT